MDKYIGKMLDDRYEIIELIGSGGMANVYKAKCHRLNRMVAIKILKTDMAENEEIRRRFQDESRAVAQLSHANIVSVYDVSTSGDTEYIVMELIDGITLKQYMARRGEMDWRESLHFIIQIMRALEHAHSRGIIHPLRARVLHRPCAELCAEPDRLLRAHAATAVSRVLRQVVPGRRQGFPSFENSNEICRYQGGVKQ